MSHFLFVRDERNPAGSENRKINFRLRLMMNTPVNSKGQDVDNEILEETGHKMLLQ